MSSTTIGIVIAALFIFGILHQYNECDARGGVLMRTLGSSYECVIKNDQSKRTQEQQLRSEDVPQR